MSEITILNRKFKNNIDILKTQFQNIFDIKYREISTSNGRACIVFIDSIVDSEKLSENIIKPLMQSKTLPSAIAEINEKILLINSVYTTASINDAITGDTKNFKTRAVEQPLSDVTILGPKESFTENIETNMSLIRRRIQNPNLKIEEFRIGIQSQLEVSLMYIDNHAPVKLVAFVRDHIESLISKDFIIGLNNIEETLR